MINYFCCGLAPLPRPRLCQYYITTRFSFARIQFGIIHDRFYNKDIFWL